LLLLVSPAQLFAAIVPFLLLAATLVFTFQDRILALIQRHDLHVAAFGIGGLAAVSVYGGYFNGGLGIILLALFSLWGMSDLATMNGLKNLLSAVISAISALAFIMAGLIHWPQVIVMALAAIAGGYAGARVSRKVSRQALRLAIALIGVSLSVIFFLRL
jgi:uncharacterized membrane protein YfcA